MRCEQQWDDTVKAKCPFVNLAIANRHLFLFCPQALPEQLILTGAAERIIYTENRLKKHICNLVFPTEIRLRISAAKRTVGAAPLLRQTRKKLNWEETIFIALFDIEIRKASLGINVWQGLRCYRDVGAIGITSLWEEMGAKLLTPGQIWGTPENFGV